MNALLDWTMWWPLPGLLAVKAAALVLSAGATSRLIVSAAWRRTIWQACVAGLVVLVGVEVIGVARTQGTPEHRSVVSEQWSIPEAEHRQVPLSAPIPPIFEIIPGSISTPAVHDSEVESGFASRRDVAAVSTQTGAWLAGWLLIAWMLGVAMVFAWIAFNQLLFLWSRRGSKALVDPESRDQVRVLAKQLNLHRQVRLIESHRFSGPVAFGIVRPVIGLPEGFTSEHRPEQRGVMLAHELAHLAALDPMWYRIADVATALLWWHPVVWWARKQLHAASEVAADEASLLVANGPGVLAECLVALGARLVQSRVPGGMGIEGSGYRSSLGRRVHRLVNLGGRVWCPPSQGALTLAKIFGPVALVLAVTIGAGWTFPDTSNKGTTMKYWQQALGVLTMAATLGAEQTALPAESPAKATAKPDANIVIAAQPVATPPPTIEVTASEVSSFAEKKGAHALREKLERLVLKEVSYDALPLSDVVNDLIRKSAEMDPQKMGVNFLFGQERPAFSPPTVDPATGLPIVVPPQEEYDLRSVAIFIQPALKNLRLIDALDAIVKVADQPIKYSIDEYAVVFSRKSVQTAPKPVTADQVLATPAIPVQAPVLQTRAFKVNTNTFFASLERMFGLKLSPNSKDVGATLQRSIFPGVGAQLSGPGTLVLYNELTAMLLVRASAEELVAIQSLIETMGGTSTSVTGAAAKPSSKSTFLNHLAEGPHTHLHRAVTGVFDALGHLAPPPFNRGSR